MIQHLHLQYYNEFLYYEPNSSEWSEWKNRSLKNSKVYDMLIELREISIAFLLLDAVGCYAPIMKKGKIFEKNFIKRTTKSLEMKRLKFRDQNKNFKFFLNSLYSIWTFLSFSKKNFSLRSSLWVLDFNVVGSEIASIGS